MRKILSITMILSTLILSSFNSNHHKISKNKQDDPANNFVVFTIDGPQNNSGMRLDFYYHDSLAYGHPVIIAGNGSKLLLNAPTFLFEASDKQTPFFIYPGEKISIKYAGSDSVQFDIPGNAQRTNELNFFRQLVQKTGNVYYGLKTMPYLKKGSSLDDIHTSETEIGSLKNTRLQFLTSFSQQHLLSSGFAKIALNSIKSIALNDSLLLYYNNRDLLNTQNLYKPMLTEKLASVAGNDFMSYQFFLRPCTMLVSLITGNSPNNGISNSKEFSRHFDFIEQNFSGTTKDFLMANAIYTAYNNTVPLAKDYIKKFNTECESKGYKKIIELKLNEQPATAYAKGGDALLMADGKTVQDMQTAMASYTGKLVVLDFWASWCGPCRAEMPYTAAIKKKYAGKDVVFVNISTDDNLKEWLNANKEESLGNDSYLLLNAPKSPFMKQYKIRTIPRYLLIGKDGRILNADAPRPSDYNLAVLINRYL